MWLIWVRTQSNFIYQAVEVANHSIVDYPTWAAMKKIVLCFSTAQALVTDLELRN